MIDLSTSYLGLALRTPLVASASPLCKDLANLRRLEEAGAAAVVLHSLFEEQITADSSSLDCFLKPNGAPVQPLYHLGVRSHLDHIRRAKLALRIPVIGSLNGASNLGWLRYAREIEDAGADALELNIHLLAAGPENDGREIEQRYCDLVENVASRVRIPVAVKVGPYFTSFANVAQRLDRAGADALVLFNRVYHPDFDLETRQAAPSLKLSTSEDLRLRLYWVAMLSKCIALDLAITGGVHTVEDVVKSIMAGAQVAMLTSALLRRGVLYLQTLEQQLIEWMERHEYLSVEQMRGVMNDDGAASGRTNYVKVLTSFQ